MSPATLTRRARLQRPSLLDLLDERPGDGCAHEHDGHRHRGPAAGGAHGGAALLDRAPADGDRQAAHDGAASRDHHASTPGGGPTLDELLAGVWEGLSAHRTVPCPVCGGSLAPRYGAGPGPVGGRCGDCASTIA